MGERISRPPLLARILILGGIAFWGLGGLGNILDPSTGYTLEGAYLLLMQAIAYYGYRRYTAQLDGSRRGLNMLLAGSILSANLPAITGTIILYTTWKPSPARPPKTSTMRGAEPHKRRAEPAGRVEEPASHLNVIGTPITGLVQGFTCTTTRTRTCLQKPIAPQGLEGCWTTCPLGCGGWGCAFLAERDSARVVFKVPRGLESIITGEEVPTIDSRVLDRVSREARAISSLRHPHLLRLLSYSTSAPLLVYEYADYGSLSWQLGRGWKPGLRDILLLGVQLGDAIRYLHSRGLVHGDIKPSNVFFVGRVAKLGDFSSLTRLLSTATTHQTIASTPGWRAPEQVYSDLRRRSVEMGYENRVDVYQLGNLLLYLLTGEHVDGEEAVASPGRLGEALGRVGGQELRSLLEAMLAPEPWSRPSMDEVVSRIARLLRAT